MAVMNARASAERLALARKVSTVVESDVANNAVSKIKTSTRGISHERCAENVFSLSS